MFQGWSHRKVVPLNSFPLQCTSLQQLFGLYRRPQSHNIPVFLTTFFRGNRRITGKRVWHVRTNQGQEVKHDNKHSRFLLMILTRHSPWIKRLWRSTNIMFLLRYKKIKRDLPIFRSTSSWIVCQSFWRHHDRNKGHRRGGIHQCISRSHRTTSSKL